MESDHNPEQTFITSPLARFLELGGLVGRVGISVLGNQTVNLLRSVERAAEESSRTWRRSAILVARRLGNLKGAAMKMGQMLSLYEGLFPAEFTEILGSLQKDAPPVQFALLEKRIRVELGDAYNLFDHIDPVPYASASIGQVHRARLKDGRDVVVKVQYPGIDAVIRADLKNLKVLLKSLFGMFTRVDLDPHWEELKARLLEELDYKREAQSLARMAAYHSANPDVVLPLPVLEATSEGVLTLMYEPGLSPIEACSPEISQALRDTWGRVLFELLCKNLFEFQYIHADPNLANFAFREDGRVVVYDFGCMKSVPDGLTAAYASIGRAVLDDRGERLAGLLGEMGIRRMSGVPLDPELSAVIFNLLRPPFRAGEPYTFGKDNVFTAIMDLKQKYWSQAIDLEAPPDLIFMDRTFAGMYGNLSRLRATGPWRDLLDQYVGEYEARKRPVFIPGS